MSQEIELLTEIRDLLQALAEPEIAKRDAKRRTALRAAVGSSKQKARAVFLMDGTRLQSVLTKETGMDSGNLSRFVKGLASAELVAPDQKHPKLLVKVPPAFFEQDGKR
jgi:hypothetical protein